MRDEYLRIEIPASIACGCKYFVYKDQTVTPGWDPPLYTNQDTLRRPDGESQMKEFRTLTLGEIELPAGEAPLTLRAIKIPGKSVMDLRRLTLTLMD